VNAPIEPHPAAHVDIHRISEWHWRITAHSGVKDLGYQMARWKSQGWQITRHDLAGGKLQLDLRMDEKKLIWEEYHKPDEPEEMIG